MHKNIIWKAPGNIIAVTVLIAVEEASATHAETLKTRGDVPADWEAVAFDQDPANLPAWQEIGDWIWDNQAGAVVVKIERARQTTKQRLRRERAQLLAGMDVAHLRAIEEGTPTAALFAEKRRLRDLPTLADAANDIAALAALKAAP